MRSQVAKFLRLAVQSWNSVVKFRDKILNAHSAKSKFRGDNFTHGKFCVGNFKILKFSLSKIERAEIPYPRKIEAKFNPAILKLAILKFSCLPRRPADHKC